MKNINIKLFLLVIFLLITGCATDDRLYRLNTFNNSTFCGEAAQPVDIDATKIDDKFKEVGLREPTNNTLLCSIQAYNRNHAVSYDLAFVEMLDFGDRKGTKTQIDALNNYIDLQLKKEEDLWVYVFVHGWRHNADIGDEDVAKFHTMLALSKNHLNQRKLNAKVLGIYVGWRGKSMDEAVPLVDIPYKTGISFFSRKTQSDKNAVFLQEFIKELETQLKAKPEKSNKLITIGHSLGGNMLLRAVEPLITETIKKTSIGEIVKGFGDLVVLLNPASELSNWQKLQNASREHAGIADPKKYSYLDDSECNYLARDISPTYKEKCKAEGTHHVYAKGQLPVAISLTSSKHLKKIKPTDEDIKQRKLTNNGNTDIATSLFFPLSQRIKNWFGEDEDIYALGQSLPKRAWNKDGKPDHEASANLIYGLSHEMEIDGATNIGTNYANALKTDGISCSADRTFLTSEIENHIKLSEHPPKAEEGKTQKYSITGGRGWDRGKLKIGKAKAADGTHGIEINVKHGVLRNKCSSRSKAEIAECDLGNSYQVPRLGHAREPYWNIAAHQNLIDGHGGYVSAALFCFVNGLVIP